YMVRRTVACIVLCGTVGLVSAVAQSPASPAQQPPKPRVETAGPAEEKVSQTSHAIRLDGREIKYTATATTLPIRLDEGKVVARMFFTAYTKDGENPRTR